VTSSNKLDMVGLAYRAGRALSGSAACEKGLKQRKVCLMLMHQALSAGTRRMFTELCERFDADMITVALADDLGRAIGKPGVMLVGITDAGFAKAIQNNYHGGSGSE
jgi:ribosomal protein L7Ae-like RNA K-turn-binding protein